ncbi:hypothetical protein PG997_004487 [Apiospora hydei]|uniref:Uncharacterized protein n=1 Tax=Apiospora hydei TaxID=1337664 RepID=A0ABR1X281_9PEZI
MPSSNQSSPNNHDIELKLFPIKEDFSSSIAQGSHDTMREPIYDDFATPSGGLHGHHHLHHPSATPPRFLRSWADGFRRDPNQRITPKDPISDIMAGESGSLLTQQTSHNGRIPSGHSYDMRMAALSTAQSSLLRRLKGRHLQMIAIGGSIGTAFLCLDSRNFASAAS